jgi:hypothetical protein
VPIDVDDRSMWMQRLRAIEPVLPPTVVLSHPVERLRPRAFSPTPALIAPEFAALVSSLGHEVQKFVVGHRRTRDAERRHLHRIGPFLVVEHKRRLRRRTKLQNATGNGDVARQRPGSDLRWGIPCAAANTGAG